MTTLEDTSRSVPQLIERLYDENGTLLQEEPYPFRCLFAVGQGQTINHTTDA